MKRLTRRQRRAALALMLVALLFVGADVVGAPYAGARGGVQGFFGALYRGTDSVVGPARRWLQALPHIGSDTDTIAKLRSDLARAQQDNARLRQDAATKAQLDRLQLQATRGGYRVLPSRVVGIGAAAGFDWTVTLDAGSRDGVKLGQTVIAGAAVVGRVVRVSATSATVLLAADPGSGVGVRNRRSGQLGVVAGRGSAGYVYTPLDPNAVPKRGEELITGPSGATTYVSGLIVGTITAVHAGTDGKVSAVVRPAVSATALDLVGVILVGGTSGPRPPLQPGDNAGGAR